VRHADLDQPPPAHAQLDQQLGRHEGAARLEPDALERLAPEELAGAVGVAHAQAEEDAQRQAVGAGVEQPISGSARFRR
jgi:hypothetical protein